MNLTITASDFSVTENDVMFYGDHDQDIELTKLEINETFWREENRSKIMEVVCLNYELKKYSLQIERLVTFSVENYSTLRKNAMTKEDKQQISLLKGIIERIRTSKKTIIADLTGSKRSEGSIRCITGGN